MTSGRRPLPDGDGAPAPSSAEAQRAADSVVRRDRKAQIGFLVRACGDLQLAEDPDPDGWAQEEDALRLLFTCCHPALAHEARVALTLQVVGGLTAREIARAFLTSSTKATPPSKGRTS